MAFLHSVPGLAFLQRLVMALPGVGVAIGACGMRLGCLGVERTGRTRVVGAASGSPQRGHRGVEEAIGAYRREARARRARAMPPTDRTLTQEATCTGGLCLVGIEPVRHAIVWEPAAPACAPDTWQGLLEPALAGLHCRGRHATRDEAPGLLASGAQHRGAPHSPDLFQVHHARRKAVAAPMAVNQRAAAKAVTQAAEPRQRGHAARAHAHGEPGKRAPGRPPQAAPCLAQVTQAVATARPAPQRRAGQRATGPQRLRAMGPADHWVDGERGGRRNGTRIVGALQRPIDTLRPLARPAHLRETGLERLAQAARVVPNMPATSACGSGSVRQPGRQRD